jgi:hypothetical protein
MLWIVMENKNAGCCPPGEEGVKVLRVVLIQDEKRRAVEIIGKKVSLNKNSVSYKASSFIRGMGRSRNKDVSSGIIQKKANSLSQIGRSVVSAAIPGDISPVRSPIRSAFWRTVTPGGGGGRGGSRPGEGRGYRCPEGYQFGGRFTDSRLSTCGAKLFDIPSPLRMALAEIRANARSRRGKPVGGSPLGAGEYPDDMIDRRKPSIPKVSSANPRKAQINIKEMASQIADFNDEAARMVRRDGFVLEPVVPASVLRTIPDNRDMEGATYILFANSPDAIGRDELGLLSNTGVTNVTYILPSGSTVSIEKVRKLSTGERRKLGRTVNNAIDLNVTEDPSSRLRFVAEEMGDGIRVKEVTSNADSLKESFKSKEKPKSTVIPAAAEPAKITSKGKITSLENAIEHLASGGSLSKIAPEIMPAVLRSSKEIQEQRLENNQRLVTIGDKKYFLYTRPERFQHLSERFASEVQQHLGLDSPKVVFAGMPNESRPYVREDVETAVPGGKLNTEMVLGDLDPKDVASMMIADYLTDQRTRENTSIYPIDANGKTRPVMSQNFSSGLTALDEIEITKRIRMGINEFYNQSGMPRYSDYYQSLKQQQQSVFRKYIQELIERARVFAFSEMRKRMSKDGLSSGERAHIEILERLFDNRLRSLSKSKKAISALLGD